ncbi:MAG TPA: lactonase family protein [Ilumatobacteraceae bacterium]|nr:lactonase family protein [Ilumatobacteraceae bacterium]
MTQQTWLYIGCYTTAATTGIHVFDASDPNGAIDRRSQVDDLDHPSFLAADVGRSTLYAVSESPDRGIVVAYRMSPTDGSLRRLDDAASHGSAPCHVSVDAARVHVANYASGTVATYLVGPDGRFDRLLGQHRHGGSGPHPRQAGPHAHCILAHGSSVYAVDLGADRIIRYVVDPGDDGGIRFADQTVMPPGSGPRHIAVHPDRPVAYVLCELDNQLAVLDIDDSGRLHPRSAVSTLPDGFTGDSIAAGIAIHPDGRRIYVSNRGHDSIATFAIDVVEDPPMLLEHVPSGGRTPRHFAIHPAGRSLLVANQDSDNLISFAFDDDAIPRRTNVVAQLSQPVCVTFVEFAR